MRLPLHVGWLRRRPREEGVADRADPQLAATCAALRAHVEASRRPREAPRAREAMRVLCEDARRRHLHAEQLLVAVKGAWRSMPASERGADERARQAALDRFVSLCIEEFYARAD